MKFIFIFIVGFLASGLLSFFLIPCLKKINALDIPNSRSSHNMPTPRGGGIAILFGIVCSLLVAVFFDINLPVWSILIGTLIIAIVSFADDTYRGLPVLLRLIFQISAAGIVIISCGGFERVIFPSPLNISLGIFSIPFTLLWILGVTNIYNFLDGIDGYASAQGIIAGFGIAFLTQDQTIMILGLSISGACLGFLLHNWHPAKVFMGDVGSSTLGFLIAVIPFQLSKDLREETAFFIAIFLWFFLADGLFTMVRRFLKKEKLWEAHRSHIYQRMTQSGLRHDQVVKRIVPFSFGLMVTSVFVARYFAKTYIMWSILILAIFIFLGFIFYTRKLANKI